MENCHDAVELQKVGTTLHPQGPTPGTKSSLRAAKGSKGLCGRLLEDSRAAVLAAYRSPSPCPLPRKNVGEGVGTLSLDRDCRKTACSVKSAGVELPARTFWMP